MRADVLSKEFIIPQPDQLAGSAFYGLSEECGVQIEVWRRRKEKQPERERKKEKK